MKATKSTIRISANNSLIQRSDVATSDAGCFGSSNKNPIRFYPNRCQAAASRKPMAVLRSRSSRVVMAGAPDQSRASSSSASTPPPITKPESAMKVRSMRSSRRSVSSGVRSFARSLASS
jgi:hypothetical protein